MMKTSTYDPCQHIPERQAGTCQKKWLIMLEPQKEARKAAVWVMVFRNPTCRSDHQLYAEPVGHDNWIQQWVTDGPRGGHKPWTGEGTLRPQRTQNTAARRSPESQLSFPLRSLWHLSQTTDEKQTSTKDRWLRKKAHRCVQAGIHPDEGNHAQVSRHGNKVKKEGGARRGSLAHADGTLKPMKINSRPGIVFTSHWLVQSLEWEKKKQEIDSAQKLTLKA